MYREAEAEADCLLRHQIVRRVPSILRRVQCFDLFLQITYIDTPLSTVHHQQESHPYHLSNTSSNQK
jgi:hypothetical protein